MMRQAAAVIALSLFSLPSYAASIPGQGTWETTLQARDLDGNAATVEAYYDTVLNITWMADANLAATESFGVTGIIVGDFDYGCGFNACMVWDTAIEWITAMNTSNYLGVSDWRLPTVTDIGEPGCPVFYFSGADCNWNMDLSTSEMAHMYYGTLGNIASYDASGDPTGCGYDPPCLSNVGPFSYIHQGVYWSGTENVADIEYAWAISFIDGGQNPNNKIDTHNAWAVTSGDVGSAIVPIPAALYLFGGALGALGWLKRRQKSA